MSAVLYQDKRPQIQLPGDNRLLSEFARDIGKAVRDADIFQRDGKAFTIAPRGDRLVMMTAETLRTWLEDYAVCHKVRRVGTSELIETRRTMTLADAAGVLNSPHFISELREIERVNPVHMPVRRFDGHIELLTAGYDEDAKAFTALNAPALVDKMHVDFAKGIINEFLKEFVFADETRSRSVALAAMLTVFAKGILPAKSIRPCFIYLANAEGAGKTLLVKLATVPVLGYAPTTVKPRDEDEMRKVLLSAVMEASQVLAFDNFKGHLASESLEGFLTNQEWSGRILGRQQTFCGENNTVVFVTGNGCTLSPDMRRRSLLCELFLDVDRPEDRTFSQHLETSVLIERRTDILSALWSLVKDWHDCMEPKPGRSHASFPEWTENIAAIVEHAGYGCPVETPRTAAAADVEGEQVRTLVGAIAGESGSGSVNFDGLLDVCEAHELFEDFRAGIRFAPNGSVRASCLSTLGKLLRRYNGRIMGKHRFQIDGTGRGRRYRADPVTLAPSDTVSRSS